MPKLQIERSIKINAPVEVVYPAVNDLSKWVEWSPWLIMDPDVKVEIAEDNKSYSWEGNRIGSGNMKVREEKENEKVVFDLNFIKPWKSVSTTSISLKNTDEGTELTWGMDTSLPFFLFWMKKMMKAFIGSDYERGLGMLKAYVEQGNVHSKLDFEGISDFQKCEWIGIKTTCSMETLGSSMQADYAMIDAFASKNEIVSDMFFTIYHKWDLIRSSVTYTAAIAVKDVPNSLPDNFMSGVIPEGKVYKLKHTGAYKHLGNAWSTLYSMHRNKEFKPEKGVHPFEVYVSDPKTTPEKELITEVYFPVK